MMEALSFWVIGVIYWVVLCFLILVPSNYAQQGFLSINCCATKNSADENNITWITDYSWFPDNSHCQEIRRPVQYSESFFVRGFTIDSGKRCYTLPTIKGRNYILRGTFVHLDSLPPSTFGVLIGVTTVSTVELPNDVVVEVIFRAAEIYIDFCLFKEEGDPLISQLELRPLNVDYYFNGDDDDDSSLLKLVSRLYLGNLTEEIRFPEDPNDRIWSPTANRMSYEIVVTSNEIKDPTTEVPSRVLEMAVQDSNKLLFVNDNLDAYECNYTIFLYFLEVNDKVEVGQRVFDVFVNGVKKVGGFDIKANGSNSNMASMNVMANGFLNITLVKVNTGYNFGFGPLCSAYEIFRIYPRLEGSRQEDVSVMVNVKSELLISNNEDETFASWSGDPCLPVPWKALECINFNGSSTVAKLDLSGNGLQGNIPSDITKLMHLNELNLSNNQFTGSIPSFPLSSKLKSLDVRQNDLTDLIPELLLILPHLQFLYFGCNPRIDNGLTYSSFKNSTLITDDGACLSRASSPSKRGLVISTVACGSFLFSIAAGIFVICFCKKFGRKTHDDDDKGHPTTRNAVFSVPSTGSIILKSISIQTYSLEYIESVTQKYKTLIGEGGFGSVYQGTLTDGREVAVKVRSATSLQGTREFENELNLLSAIRHENLVPLIGFCCEKDQQILVYPFMSNGSLQDRLYGESSKRKVLDWPTRLSIALGAARGLAYLHSFSIRSIIHRDVKSSNILLDHSMLAKVADFGFSKYAPQEGDSTASLEVRGTAGYLDPEYYSTQHLSAKSDVFSFGVVLLEIISGREPLNVHRPRNEWSLVEWAKPLYREQKIDEMVDRELKGMFHAEAVWRVVEVALACIEPLSAYRPTMANIVRELEDALIIETNASEYMKSIDSIGGSNRFSVNLDRRNSNSRSLSSTATFART